MNVPRLANRSLDVPEKRSQESRSCHADMAECCWARADGTGSSVSPPGLGWSLSQTANTGLPMKKKMNLLECEKITFSFYSMLELRF